MRMEHAHEGFHANQCLVAQADLRLIPELYPAVADRFFEVELRQRRLRYRCAKVAHGILEDRNFERLEQRCRHLQRLQPRELAQRLDHQHAGVAHQLQYTGIGALAQRMQRFDSVGAFGRDIEENHVRRRARQRVDQADAVGKDFALGTRSVDDGHQRGGVGSVRLDGVDEGALRASGGRFRLGKRDIEAFGGNFCDCGPRVSDDVHGRRSAFRSESRTRKAEKFTGLGSSAECR